MSNPTRRIVIALFLVAGICMTSALLKAEDGPIGRYYYDMTERGMHQKWDYPEVIELAFRRLAVKEELKSDNNTNPLTIFVFVGDLFDFIGERTRPTNDGKQPYNVDAVVFNTNVKAEWGQNVRNPHVQKTLFDKLSRSKSGGALDAFKEINGLFQLTDELHAAEQGISTKRPLNFSPRQFCFVATDTVEDGSYKNLTFLNEVLTEEKLSKGISQSLELAESMGAKSVVMPFLASSRPDLRGDLDKYDKAYLSSPQVKNEIIKRLNISLCGILRGSLQFHEMRRHSKTSINEIGIVLYHKDVHLLSSRDRNPESTEVLGIPGLQRRLFDDFTNHLEHAKKGKDCISPEDRKSTVLPPEVK